jgi:hypothetical protein
MGSPISPQRLNGGLFARFEAVLALALRNQLEFPESPEKGYPAQKAHMNLNLIPSQILPLRIETVKTRINNRRKAINFDICNRFSLNLLG